MWYDEYMHRFSVFRLVALFALLAAGCTALLSFDTLPPGANTAIPPGYVAVFGSVEHEKGKGLFHQFFGAGGPGAYGRLRLIPIQRAESLAKEGQDAKFRDHLILEVTTARDFFALIPKEDFAFAQFRIGNTTIFCPALDFTPPRDASAVYVGKLVFRERWGSFHLESITFSIVDDYDQAVRRLHDRNPDLQGKIAKSVLSREGAAVASERRCAWEMDPPAGGVIPLI